MKQMGKVVVCIVWGVAVSIWLAGCGSRGVDAVPVTQQPSGAATKVGGGDGPAEPPPPPDDNAGEELGFSSGGCRSALSLSIVTLVVSGLAGFGSAAGVTQRRKRTGKVARQRDNSAHDSNPDTDS